MNKRQMKKELSKAVANFNKIKNEVEKATNNLILPETINFQNLKKRIITKENYNETLKDIKKFGKGDSLEIYETYSGDKITKWEHEKLEKEKTRILKRLNKELEKYKQPNEQGFTKAQMGNAKYRDLLDDIKKYKNYEQNKGYDFKKIRNNMNIVGDNDYLYKKALIYKENMLEELEKLSKNSKTFKQVYNYFKKIENPIKFFNTTRKSEALIDFFEWYENPELYAGFDNSDDLASYIIVQYS